MTAKKKIPTKPEAIVLTDEEDDNVFFAIGIETEGLDAAAELALVVDVKNTGDEDSMEYLYSIFLEREDLAELIEWAKKAISYIEHVETHGISFPVILGVEDADGNVESL